MVNKEEASNIVLGSMMGLLIGIVVANGWLDDFHNFIVSRTGGNAGATPHSGPGPTFHFIEGFAGLWIILQFMIEMGAPDLAATIAGLIVTSFLLLKGNAISDNLQFALGR